MATHGLCHRCDRVTRWYDTTQKIWSCQRGDCYSPGEEPEFDSLDPDELLEIIRQNSDVVIRLEKNSDPNS